MDPVSHALIGSAVAAISPDGAHPAVIWGALIGAELPDIDFVVRYFKGPVGYLRLHRGPTHGLVSLVAESLAVAGLFALLWPGAPFGPTFLFTLLGCLSHVLSDFGNDYGTQGFWPFTPKRVALDLIPIVDLRLLAIILAGWVVHFAWPGHRQLLFAGVWFALAAYTFTRFLQHRRAVRLVESHFDLKSPCGEMAPCGDGWREERVTIHPTLLSFNAWRYVVQMPGEVWSGMVWVNHGRVGDPEKATNAYDQVVQASKKSQVVSAFAGWVRRPRAEVIQRDGLYQVRWSDMRYEVDGFAPFTAYAWLDENLTLVDEGLGSQRPEGLDREAVRRRLRREMGRLEPQPTRSYVPESPD